MGSAPKTLRRVVLSYCVWFCVGLGLACLLFYGLADRVSADPIASVRSKTAYLRENASEFDTVFLGDSRTFCAMHPHLLDPLLGTRSYNASHWAHWFPTQYAALLKLLPALLGKTVVWSIGFRNFRPTGPINDAFPIRLADAPTYLKLGFSASDLRSNLLYHNPFDRADKANTAFLRWSQAEPGWSAPAPSRLSGWRGHGRDDPQFARARELLARFEPNPEISTIRRRVSGAATTSVALRFRRGSYLRVEIDSEFFRAKQNERVSARRAAGESLETWPPVTRYVALFRHMLRVLRDHGVRVVVNELEEAPQTYIPGQCFLERQFMREHVQPLVEAYGFPYVRVNFDRLEQADYFDYNHLNSRGVEKFTRLFADALRPYLN